MPFAEPPREITRSHSLWNKRTDQFAEVGLGAERGNSELVLWFCFQLKSLPELRRTPVLNTYPSINWLNRIFCSHSALTLLSNSSFERKKKTTQKSIWQFGRIPHFSDGCSQNSRSWAAPGSAAVRRGQQAVRRCEVCAQLRGISGACSMSHAAACSSTAARLCPALCLPSLLPQNRETKGSSRSGVWFMTCLMEHSIAGGYCLV